MQDAARNHTGAGAPAAARAHGGEQQGELRQCAGRGGQHGLPRGGGALHRGRFARRGRAGVSGQRRACYPAGTFPHAGMLRLRLPHGGQRGHPPAGRRRAAPLVRGQARRFAGRARVGGGGPQRGRPRRAAAGPDCARGAGGPRGCRRIAGRKISLRRRFERASHTGCRAGRHGLAQ